MAITPPHPTYNPPPPITLPSVVFSHPIPITIPFSPNFKDRAVQRDGAAKRGGHKFTILCCQLLLPHLHQTGLYPFLFLLEAGIHEGKISRNWRDRTYNRWREAPNAKVDKQLTYNPPPHLYPPPPLWLGRSSRIL